jgi:hypothetical protein
MSPDSPETQGPYGKGWILEQNWGSLRKVREQMFGWFTMSTAHRENWKWRKLFPLNARREIWN